MKTLPSGPSARARAPWYTLLFWSSVWISPFAGLTVFFISMGHTNAENQVPWWGALGIAPLVIPLALVLLRGWLRMTLAFSPNPIARLFFGLLTLLMAGTVIGFLVDIYLYSYVMAGQPRILTGEPLAPGPHRDRWLAERRPQQNVYIDARQVHLHGS